MLLVWYLEVCYYYVICYIVPYYVAFVASVVFTRSYLALGDQLLQMDFYKASQ